MAHPTFPTRFIRLCLLSLLCGSSAMRIVVQRVKSASVSVVAAASSDPLSSSPERVAHIGPGVLALVGLHEHDTTADLETCCRKLLACKLWPNESGALWRHGVQRKNLQILLVSQFTLYGTLSRKNQPDYKAAMKAEAARKLYSEFVDMVRQAYAADKVQDGVFGAMMEVELVNDGPVTLILESQPRSPDSEANDLGETSNIGDQKEA